MIAAPHGGAVRAFLFYRESAWPILFSRLLKPLIDDLQRKDRIAGFTVFLQSNRGDHIRLTLYLQGSEHLSGNILQEDLRQNIQTFFSSYPSPETPPASSNSYFFMDFPPNTLYFDLPDHGPQNRRASLPINTKPLAQEISRILLTGLATEGADDRYLTTIALYMEFALLRAMETNLPDGARGKPSAAGKQLIEGAFPDSRHIFLQLKKEVWADDNRLSWLKDWTRLCARLFTITSCMSPMEYTDFVSVELFRHFNIPSLLGAALHNELKNELLQFQIPAT